MPAASLVDTIIGGCYRLLRPLGEGGMGVVYEAQHLRLGIKIAVKILSPQHAADSKFRDRFRREARAASQVRHPNVVQIIDFGETPNGSVFFAMERLEGHDLQHILHEHAPAPFPWPRGLHLLAQAADALAAAHRSGIVHRDVKPSNIFVLEGPGLQDFVKLLDFGIAKIVAPGATADSALVKNLTGTGEIFGTAKYMAPEQAYGGANDPRMDVYSLGVVAYELLTGRVPFTGQSNFEIVTRHVYDAPRPPRELRPDLPAALEAVVLRAMEKKPENRFATMEEFGQALRQVGSAGARSDEAGSAVPRARAHTSTDANTLPRTRRKDILPVEPTKVHPPMPAAATPQVAAPVPAAAPAPVASVVRKTIPAFAAAPLPAQAAGPLLPTQGLAASPPAPVPASPFGASPVAPPPAAHRPAAHPVAQPAVAHPSAPPPAASPTDNLGRMHAPTGPLARRRGSAYDDTGRDVAMRRPAAASGIGRWAALAIVGALAVASFSALAVILVLGPDEDEPTSMEARALTPEPTVVTPQPLAVPGSAPSPVAEAPASTVTPPGGTNEPDAATDETPGLDTPVPAPAPDVAAPPAAGLSASDPKYPSPKSPSSKPRPRPVDPDPDGAIAKEIGRALSKKIRSDCRKLGNGKQVIIELMIGRDGRIENKIIGAVGPLRACIIEAIGSPQFPKKTTVKLSPVIGECIEGFGAIPKCK